MAGDTAIFTDETAGTSKSLLLSVIDAHGRGTLRGVMCTATSAIAATRAVPFIVCSSFRRNLHSFIKVQSLFLMKCPW